MVASSAFSTIWTVNNQNPEAADFGSMSAAIEGASNFDTIYVQPTMVAYDFAYLNKSLTIIGAGHEFVEGVGYSYIPAVSIQNGATGSSIKSIATSGIISPSNVVANGVKIIGCKILGAQAFNLNPNGSTFNDWDLRDNILIGDQASIDLSILGGYTGIYNNLIVSNGSQYTVKLPVQTAFKNNTVIYANSSDFIGVFESQSTQSGTHSVYDNIIYGINSTVVNPINGCTGCNLYDNLFYHEGFTLPEIPSNLTNQDPMFQNIDNFIFNIYNNYLWDVNLNEGSPAIGAGLGGWDWGVYGLQSQFSKYGHDYFLPRIASITNPSLSTPEDGLLTVNLNAFVGTFTPLEINTASFTTARYFIDFYTEGFQGGYDINFGGGDLIDGAFNFPIPFEAAGYGQHTLYVRMKDSNGKWSLLASVPFFVCNIEPLVVTSSGTTCQGSEMILSTNQEYLTYAWSNGGDMSSTAVTSEGTYTLTVTDEDCSTSANIFANFIDFPQPIIQQTEALCIGGFTTLFVDDIYDTYLWSNGANTSSMETVFATDHTVEVSLNGCTTTVQYTLVEYPYPNNDITASNVLCQGGTVVLSVDETIEEILWSNGSTDPSISITEPGNYSVEVVSNGCYDYGNIDIEEIVIPTTTISASGNLLSASTSGLNYQWYFNDLPIDGATIETFEAMESGLYAVEVSSNGCSLFSEEFNHIYIGVNEYNSSDVVLYPNPAANTLKVSGLSNSSMTWEILDMTGRKLMNGSALQNTIDVSSLASGYYHFAMISNGDRTVKAFSVEK